MCRERHARLNEAAIERGLDFVGKSFFSRPEDLRHPLFSGLGVVDNQRFNLGDVLKRGNVELVGQGPLPISFRQREYYVTATAFRINNQVGHEALGIFSTNLKGDEYKVSYLFEDHAPLVVQSIGGGSLWHQLDCTLADMFTYGGGVVLFPDFVKKQFTKGKLNLKDTMGNISDIVGGTTSKLITNLRGTRESLEGLPLNEQELSTVFDKNQLKHTRISVAERVILPFSDVPFLHIGLNEKNNPNTHHHLWVYGDVKSGVEVPFRPHSACSSSEVFGANNCDCPEQLDAAFRHVVHSNSGVVMYLDQEARGHGVWAKVQTWPLNIGHGADLFTAFNAAGLPEDVRTFECVKDSLNALRVKSVLLMSNNGTVKANGLLSEGVDIRGMLSIHPVHTDHQSHHLEVDLAAKKQIRGDQFENPEVVSGNMVLMRH